MNLPDTQKRVYRFLSALEAFEAGWETPASHDKTSVVHTTNQSVVFLAGNYAYKLFKAIHRHRDNTTLAARLENAQLELAANHVLAAELYIGIQAVVEQPDQSLVLVDLGDEGPRTVLDYVVKMHRFNDEELLYMRLFEKKLTKRDLFKLGKRVATYHTQQAPVDDAACGPYEAFYRDFARTIGYFVEKLPEDTQKAAVHKLLAPGQELIRARQSDFMARSGKRCIIHGDLDFGNITTFNGKILPFDAQVLLGDRAEDPAKDLAFMLAPLLMYGEHRLAIALINGYQEVARDATLMHVLPFWVAYAAIVRGGSWFSRADVTCNRQEANHLKGYANMFFTLAKALLTERVRLYP